MKGITYKQMKELMTMYTGNPEGMPEFDLDGQVEFIDEFLVAGSPEFKGIFLLCNISWIHISAIQVMSSSYLI